MPNKFIQVAALALTLTGLTACVTQDSTSSSAALETQLFEVHHDNGRIYVFDNQELYLQTAEGRTPLYHRTRIGGGPDGQTMVFGLNSAQSQKTGDIDFIQIFDGEVEVSGNFYGEMRRDGRIYVFERLEDMHATRTSNPLYYVNQIGAGPDGQTVFYVQNNDTSGKPADHMIEKFKAVNE
ncbi:hypothetical protein SAMN05660443_2010 [Marinospirillum celere]|uniref:Lipoprotein n=1 Tax=Marinospirillum celere TaxID=1122252 RepID=A0A1I1HTA4_9GAMM|nr:hypothetical protein [Marinospirillum celere]SFC27116.1 hypothetical protein SAMN05660443_2010 [Marinospirillum celere]